MSTRPQPRLARAGERFTLILTNLGKVIGVLAAFKQLLLVDHPTNLALLVSFGLVVGSQGIESLVLRALDRMLEESGRGEKADG